jgi:hypothetical protein
VIQKLPYKTFPLHGGGLGYSAVLNVQVALPAGNTPRTRRLEAMIDSGASRCLFHAAIGQSIGLNIAKGETEETLGVNGPSRIYLHDIGLYIPGGLVEIRAGFSFELPIAGLLGMTGFFDHFKIIFDPILRHCELERLAS